MKPANYLRSAGLIILCFFIGQLSSAQDSFIKSYGGVNSDFCYSSMQTSDDGFILAGYTRSFGAGNDDVYLVKTDKNGDTTWTRTYGGLYNDRAEDVKQTSDNGYIITGRTESYGNGKHDIYVIKTDAIGDTLWTKTIGGSEEDYGYSVQIIPTGYIIAGITKSKGAGEWDMYLIKMNTDGSVVWDKTYGTSDPEIAYHVEVTNDNGFIMCGHQDFKSEGDYYDRSNAYIVKTDANGIQSWSHTTSGGWLYNFRDIKELDEGGYICAGSDEMAGIIYKIDSDGSKIWHKGFLTVDFGYEFFSVIIDDTSYVFAGSIYDQTYWKANFYLCKTDTSGNVKWERNYGESNENEYLISIFQGSDGSLIGGGGHEVTIPSKNYNACLVKFDTVGCITPAPAIGGSTTICDGWSVSLFETTGVWAEYLWSTGGTLSDLLVTEAGDYTVTVTDFNGCSATSDTFTVENTTPRVSLQANGATTFCDGDSVEIVANISNYYPESDYNYQWHFEQGLFFMDSSIVVKTPGSYYVNVVDQTHICNGSSDTIEVLVGYPYPDQEICLVGVDLETGKNMVIWERHEDLNTTFYKIYRETTTGGVYEVLDTIPYNKIGVYVDSTSQPEIKSHKYRISVVDTCGNESDPSPNHKTMLLTSSLGSDRINLSWTEYQVEGGSLGFVKYIIYRGPSPGALEPIDSIPSDNTIYPDIYPPDGDNFYRVAGVKADPCNPTGDLKAGSGPYSHSMSNIEDNRLQVPAENQAPTDLNIDITSIDENAPVNTLVGRFTTTDPDVGDSHIYALVSGTGDNDNSSFIITGDSLLAGEVFDYETKNIFSIRVSTTDTGDVSFEKQITIFVTDVVETGIEQTANNALRIYPNPFSDETTITFPNPENQKYQFRIIDITGNIIYTESISASKYILEKQDLNAGVYILEIKGERIFHGRIVIE